MGSLPLCRGRTHLAPDVGGDDLIDDGVSQGFLALEVVVQCALGDPGYFQNGVQAGTLETRSVNLTECRLQQALPRALRDRAAWSFYVSDSCVLPTYQPVCMLII